MLDQLLIENEDYILTRNKNILKKLGITTVKDLLDEFPISYDYYLISELKDATLDQQIVLEGSVAGKITVNHLKNKLSTLNFMFNVEGKMLRATIFNRVFLKNKLDYGTVIRASGKFYKNYNNFTITDFVLCDEINRDIIPVYRAKDISMCKYTEIIEKAYRHHYDKLIEYMPKHYLDLYQLISYRECVRLLHYPESQADIEKAYCRLKYEEALKYQISMKYLHFMRYNNTLAPQINYDETLLKQLQKSLDYTLTGDQQKVVSEILDDLKAPHPMNRLLQGEVGSGKTIVAIMAILACVSDGFQAALMCPTEILAKQHLDTLTKTLSLFPNIKIALLTGSTSQKNRKEMLPLLKQGDINIIVGTHALFQNDVEYDRLGLVIADEEHRFGVKQRVLIRNKGLEVNYLKMSATPIPRTLSLAAYGDMDISTIKEMPKNRKTAITKYIDPKNKKQVMAHIKKELKIGHQIYLVTPLIEESENLDATNAVEIYHNMITYFDGVATIGLIHGRLKPAEKEEIMNQFLEKKIDILVATSVIEVGVNVTNATTIVIFGAERFGVATLHQLRGRVMRSEATPYCFLLSDKQSENGEKRLKMLEEKHDGFELAEYDLATRGPGEFFGERQSGSINFTYLDLKTDMPILEQANFDSDEIINQQLLFNDPAYNVLYEHAKQNYEMKLKELD